MSWPCGTASSGTPPSSSARTLNRSLRTTEPRGPDNSSTAVPATQSTNESHLKSPPPEPTAGGTAGVFREGRRLGRARANRQRRQRSHDDHAAKPLGRLFEQTAQVVCCLPDAILQHSGPPGATIARAATRREGHCCWERERPWHPRTTVALRRTPGSPTAVPRRPHRSRAPL